ncbi:hypothetical protein [Propionibacterium australiense]|uniref:hypothetical protein n=1 Tax=Propionibacterium australiense TaxID=119981 RepID=UPI000F82E3BA|nr:hypothetical protein [Propionibacterium australiense]
MSARTVAFIGALCFSHQDLIPILQEHLDEMDGEILPHLVMSDIIRWMVLNYEDDPSVVKRVIDWISDVAQEYKQDQEIIDLISVSGMEMIPDPGKPGSVLRDWLPPVLKKLDPWLY